jgi:hypothetical protein
MKIGVSKKLIFLVIAGFAIASANAQVQFGLKAGVNFATITNSTGGKTLVAFNGGALVKVPVADAFSIQPELVYSGQGIKGDGGSLALTYINIPVLATYTLPVGVFFQTGPQLGFLLSAKAKADGQPDVDIKSEFKSSDFAWAIGAGFLSPMNLGFNLRYNIGISNLGQNGGTSKNGVFQIGVFYLFGANDARK